MISTLVLIGAACMYTYAYPQAYLTHAHTPLLRSTRRLLLSRRPNRSPEGQHVISRRTIVSLLSPSGFIGSAARDALAKVFSRQLKVKTAPKKLWVCEPRMVQWTWRGVAEMNYRRNNSAYQCTNRNDGRKILLQSYPPNWFLHLLAKRTP
jgi:hypothetical protein